MIQRRLVRDFSAFTNWGHAGRGRELDEWSGFLFKEIVTSPWDGTRSFSEDLMSLLVVYAHLCIF